MNDELLMDLADCGSPDSLVGAILKHHPDLPVPVPVETIAGSVGITSVQDLAVEGFEGGLLANPEKSAGVIMVKLGIAPRRRRFTIGHELGHFLVPTHQGAQQCTKRDLEETRRDTPYRRREAEANRFSAGLLMPKPAFQRDIRRLGSIDAGHIRALGDLYDTSMEATANRYVELTRDICAVVFSREGVVRYVRASRDFPALGIRRGSPLPPGSATARHRGQGTSTWRETPGSTWLELDPRSAKPPVLEQHVVQANGFSVTLLHVEEQAVEDEEEETALEDSWRISFRGRR